MITGWKLAMVLLLPLMLLQQDRWPTHKIRTWAAVMGASFAAILVTPTVGYVPLVAYVLIDFIAGAIVLTRPAGVAQKAIGFLFAVMILFSIGAGLGGNHAGDGYYRSFLISAGWAQWAILLLWSGWDVGRSIVVRFRRRSHLASDGENTGAGR